jgi:hypothetical protein
MTQESRSICGKYTDKKFPPWLSPPQITAHICYHKAHFCLCSKSDFNSNLHFWQSHWKELFCQSHAQLAMSLQPSILQICLPSLDVQIVASSPPKGHFPLKNNNDSNCACLLLFFQTTVLLWKSLIMQHHICVTFFAWMSKKDGPKCAWQ